MWTRRLRPGLVLVVAVGIVAQVILSSPPVFAQMRLGPGGTTTAPTPMAAIEFVKESGVDRWEVKLTRGGTVEEVNLRISGASCSHMGEIYAGMITPLYDDMSFRTKNGRLCTVQAIER